MGKNIENKNDIKEMTKNEYQQFLKTNASRIYREEGYTFKNYCQDAAAVKVLPFDLGNFEIEDDIVKFINTYFDEEIERKDSELLLKGFSESDDIWFTIKNNLGLKDGIGNGYGGYCHNKENLFYMTYSEGDLYLNIFNNKCDFEKSLAKTDKWYKENL